MDYLPPPLPPGAGLQAAGRCARASSQAQGGRPPRTPPGGADDPRAGADRSSLGPGGEGEQEVSILQRSSKQSESQPSRWPAPLGGRRPEERRAAGPGSATTPHPGPAPEVPAGRARRLRGTTSPGPAVPPRSPGAGPDRTRTPRHARPARIGARTATWRGLPGRLRATLRSQVPAELAPGRAHRGSGRATPPRDGHYLGRNS